MKTTPAIFRHTIAFLLICLTFDAFGRSTFPAPDKPDMIPPPTINITFDNFCTDLKRDATIEDSIVGEVFLRNTKLIALIATNCTFGMTASIRLNGVAIANLTLSSTSGGKKAEWMIPAGAKVGEYSIRVTCGSDVVSKNFFVIFNPAEVGTFDQFSFKSEVAVWFDCPYSERTRANVYQLHPDDQRVFGRAIQAIQGFTDIKLAAEKLMTTEAAIFDYGLTRKASDVIDLLNMVPSSGPKAKAQCADDAALLVAMMRSVGICAYTVTADADETNNSWSFDTWVEYLAPANPNPKRWVLHPHEYPTMTSQERSTFGSTRNVAKKNVNDIIVMADVPLGPIPPAITNLSSDVCFTRKTCKEPDQTLHGVNTSTAKPAWVTELCENYWGATSSHWACSGNLDLNRAARVATVSNSNIKWLDRSLLDAVFIFDSTELIYGAPFQAEFAVLAPNNMLPANANLTIRLVADDPRSKILVDSVLDSYSEQIQLNPDKTFSQTFNLNLPTSLPANYEIIFLEAFISGGGVPYPDTLILAQEELILPKPLSLRVSADSNLVRCSQYTLKAALHNTGFKTINDIEVGIETPYALIPRHQETLKIPALAPGEKKTLQFKYCTDAVLQGGSIEVNVVSKNGGSRKDYVGVVVRQKTRSLRNPFKKYAFGKY